MVACTSPGLLFYVAKRTLVPSVWLLNAEKREASSAQWDC